MTDNQPAPLQAQQLQPLFKQFQVLLDAPEQANNHFLRNCLDFSEQLLTLVRLHPHPLVACLMQPPTHFSQPQRLIWQRCLWVALCGLSSQLNPNCIQQLLCALLSQPHANSRALPLLLKQSQQNLWLYCMRLAANTRTAQLLALAPSQLDPASRIFCLALLLHSYQNHANKQQRPYAAGLRQLYQRVSPSWLHHLAPLLAFPGLIPPGSWVTDKQGSAQLVLSAHQQRLATYLPGKQKVQWQTAKHVQVLHQHLPLNTEKYHLAWGIQWQNLLQHSQLNSHQWPKIYRLDRPPATLLLLQELLSAEQPEMEKITQVLAGQPQLAEHLKHSASQANRKQLPVHDLTHSVMMHGFTQSQSHLIRHALLLRLSQLRFPLQQAFLQFVELRSQILMQLAEPVIGRTQAEHMGTISAFSLAGLFTQAKLKITRYWHIQHQQGQQLATLSSPAIGVRLQQQAVQLARAWQQPKSTLRLLQQAGSPPTSNQPPAQWLLDLSLLLARQSYFGQPYNDAASQSFLQQAYKALKLSKDDCQRAQQQGLIASQSCWPISLKWRAIVVKSR